MSDKQRNEDVLLEDHDYDGIQEFDNPMPRWWINIFIGTVVFAAIYVVHYEFGSGQGIHETYLAEVAAFEEAEAVRLAKAGAASEASLTDVIAVASAIAEGKNVYATNCQACHGSKGEGIIGPNLTDEYWLHGDGSLMGIYSTVSEGVLAKGMPAWSRVLSPQQLEKVVAYVGTMRGKNVEGGKDPEGDPVGTKGDVINTATE
ncbi:MAG: cbb3-type cytochrome c oxidase N-terminal domain-containing protein [Myxococcota bacterium]